MADGPIMRALYSTDPIVVDGKLDEDVWSRAPAYEMAIPQDRQLAGATPREAGVIRLAWDDHWLYVAMQMTDSDVVQESNKDQEHHFKFGDVCEVFLKPRQATWYWEMYATPNGRRTSYFFPGRGRLSLPSNFVNQTELKVAAQVDGTLNDWRDRDEGWTAEMAIPRAELATAGIPLDAEHPWSILVGRYNYSRYLPDLEISACPPMHIGAFHRHEEYAALELVRP